MILMVVVEEGRNIPSVVGPSNYPPVPSWGIRNIASLPSVIMNGLDRSFLPQVVKGRPLRTLLLTRPLVIPRRRLLSGQFEWPEASRWTEGADVGSLPSVIGILSGPRRSLHPKQDLSVQM